MAAIIKLTGFSGYVIVDDIQILALSANINQDQNLNNISFIDIKRDDTPRSRVNYAPGTIAISGSVSFDLTADSLPLFSTSRLFKRNYTFNVKVFDGNEGKQLSNCYVNSISLNGSVGGLLNASVNFISKNLPTDYVGGEGSFQNTKTVKPYGYWYSGRTDAQVRDWSFSYNQNAVPVYLNQIGDGNRELARYIRVGLQEFTLNLNTYEEITPSSTENIVVATSEFTIVGRKASQSYNLNGITDVGTYSYGFNSVAVTAPNENILS